MITRTGPGPGLHLQLLAGLPVLVTAWLALLVLVLRLGAPAPAVLVLFPPPGFVRAIGNAEVTGASPFSLTLRSDMPNLAARAHAAGAWFVLPAGLEACIPPALRQQAQQPDTGPGPAPPRDESPSARVGPASFFQVFRRPDPPATHPVTGPPI